jgi:hypothetical protein
MPTNSVVKEPPKGLMPGNDLIISIASVADDIQPWGTRPAFRDRQLRSFWHTEPILASAIYSTASRYAAFGWHLEGPDRMVNIITRLLHSVEFGKGWITLISKVLIDLFTQDNGAFVEVIRTDNTPTSPVVSLNHLDANKCVRTGRREEPVIYYDRLMVPHEMKWYQILDFTEFPSPIESMNGMQYCAVTRLLRAAQILRDISIYKREKISGRFTRAVHLVSGVAQKSITDVLDAQQLNATNEALVRYIQPAIIASLDPTATVAVATLNLASLPDGFDEEIAMRWYINQLALAFGSDYQDFAPLPGGNLGTAQQSQTLHLKSRVRGSLLFMRMVEQAFNYQGIMPPTVKFEFGDQDFTENIEDARVKQMRALERKLRLESGEISPQVARLLAVQTGDLDDDMIAELDAWDKEQEAKAEAAQKKIAATTDNNTKPFNNKEPLQDKTTPRQDATPSGD